MIPPLDKITPGQYKQGISPIENNIADFLFNPLAAAVNSNKKFRLAPFF
jgi:hypothetical protein